MIKINSLINLQDKTSIYRIFLHLYLLKTNYEKKIRKQSYLKSHQKEWNILE